MRSTYLTCGSGMKYGICTLGVIPVFRIPEITGEIINQLLFGETFEVVEKQGILARIRSAHDQYEGWIDSRQTEAIGIEEFSYLAGHKHAVIGDLFAIVVREGIEFPVVKGGTLPQDKNGHFSINSSQYILQGTSLQPPQEPIELSHFVNIARSYLNCPYHWGGRSPFGIDCSGFVQTVFKCLGVKLKRDACQQIHQGEEITHLNDAKIGDVAFFNSIATGVPHVGIVWFQGQIIHAAVRVQINRLDSTGIYSDAEERYTHRLTAIRRVAEIV
jgi:cell wall-associated NlpC family hydrolase